jgi:hypothetical protein
MEFLFNQLKRIDEKTGDSEKSGPGTDDRKSQI